MAQVNFRVDDNVKSKAEKACADMGISMTAAINIFLVKLGNERRIPFEVSADPFYSKDNIEELERRIAYLKAGITELKEHDLIEGD